METSFLGAYISSLVHEIKMKLVSMKSFHMPVFYSDDVFGNKQAVAVYCSKMMY